MGVVGVVGVVEWGFCFGVKGSITTFGFPGGSE